MFRFEHIEFLFSLLLVPAIGGIVYLFFKKQKQQWDKINTEENRHKFIIGKVHTWNPLFIGITLATIALLGIALGNPQYSIEDDTVSIESSDVFIALDISKSMDATDIKPTRLERAKILASDILRKLEGNRVGIILFAGEAYMHMPLTSDVSSAMSFLETANTGLAPTQGTAIGASIRMALKSFDEEVETGKAIIMLSDGEDHEAEIDDAIDDAEDQNVRVFTVAVGTERGAYIPDNGDSYVFNEQGKPVKSQVNESMLKEIASATNGIYYNIDRETNIEDAIMKNVEELEKVATQEASVKNFKSYFQWLVFPAILLLVGRFVFLFVKNKKINL